MAVLGGFSEVLGCNPLIAGNSFGGFPLKYM
jgi:hypothetical protein